MRELSYEMIRVQNNTNIRFNEGYFGWVKFELSQDSIKEIDKSFKLDEEVVRYIIVKTVRDNTVFTKRVQPVKIEDLKNNEDDTQIDTTTEETPVEAVLPETVELPTSGEVK